MTDAQDLIERLRRYREANKLTYDDLAIDMGLRSRSLYRWLKEEENPSRMSVRIIREFLKRKG